MGYEDARQEGSSLYEGPLRMKAWVSMLRYGATQVELAARSKSGRERISSCPTDRLITLDSLHTLTSIYIEGNVELNFRPSTCVDLLSQTSFHEPHETRSIEPPDATPQSQPSRNMRCYGRTTVIHGHDI